MAHVSSRRRSDRTDRSSNRLEVVPTLPPPPKATARHAEASCGREGGRSAERYSGQFTGGGGVLSRSAVTEVFGGTKYVTMFVAGAPDSLRARCACSPTSRNPSPADRTLKLQSSS